MKPSDYELLTNSGDKYPTIGFCPFCEQPGWITGDDEWCEHYIGTSDSKSAAGPLGVSVFPIIQELPIYQQLENKITEYKELTCDKQKTFLKRIPPKYRVYLQNIVENDWLPTAFLDFFHDFEYLDCECDGPEYTEHCVSFFVKDQSKLHKEITRIFTIVINKLEFKGNT